MHNISQIFIGHLLDSCYIRDDLFFNNAHLTFWEIENAGHAGNCVYTQQGHLSPC